MGTTWKLIFAEALTENASAAIASQVQRELDRLTRIFSTWEPSSILSQFNREISDHPFEVPPEVLEVAKVAHSLSLATQGAFDVTVEPILQRLGLQPSQANDLSALEPAGYQNLELLENPPRLRKKHPELKVNFTALVEGLAIDHVAQILQAAGITNCLFELGGELYASGRPTPNKRWKVGVQHPNLSIQTPYAEVELEDEALSTSGTYRQQKLGLEGTYSHILDARTGKPVRHGHVSITVKHKKSLWADGWATALMTLNEEEAKTLSQKEKLSAMMIRKEVIHEDHNKSEKPRESKDAF